MTKNLWNYFNCDSIEELSSKVLEGDISVNELIEDYKTVKDRLNLVHLGSTKDTKNYIEHYNLVPKMSEMYCIAINNKNRVLGHFPLSFSPLVSTMQIEKTFDFKSFMQKMQKMNAPCVQMIFNIQNPRKNMPAHPEETINQLEETIQNFGYSVLPSALIDRNYLEIAEQEIGELDPLNALDGSHANYALTHIKNRRFKEMEGYKDLSILLLKRTIEGKNYIFDNEAIHEALTGYLQSFEKEYILMMYMAQDFKVKQLSVESIGTSNAALANPSTILNSQLNYDRVLMLHNHPSGNPEPSSKDVDMHYRLKKVSELVGFDYVDSLVVGDRITSIGYLTEDLTLENLKEKMEKIHDKETNLER